MEDTTVTCPHCGAPLITAAASGAAAHVCARCRHVINRHAGQQTSWKALASLTLGIGASALSCFAGVPVIVFGLLALREIGRSDGKLGGQRVAMAGVATGVLFGVLCTPIVGLIAVPVYRNFAARLPGGPPIIRSDQPTFSISVPFSSVKPNVDGRIDPQEYGLPVAVDFTAAENPGILWSGGSHVVKSVEDLSFSFMAVHDATTLYLAFQVYDQQVKQDPTAPVWENDSIEVFIDGDRAANDFVIDHREGNREGFQVLLDAGGKKQTGCADFKNKEWRAATQTAKDGYGGEFAIPLALIDVADGEEYRAATTGSAILFNALINDHDGRLGDSDAAFWAHDVDRARPYWQGEPVWTIELRLTGPPE